MAKKGESPQPYPVDPAWLRGFATQIAYAAKKYNGLAAEIEKHPDFKATGRANAEMGLKYLNTWLTTLQREILRQMGGYPNPLVEAASMAGEIEAGGGQNLPGKQYPKKRKPKK